MDTMSSIQKYSVAPSCEMRKSHEHGCIVRSMIRHDSGLEVVPYYSDKNSLLWSLWFSHPFYKGQLVAFSVK